MPLTTTLALVEDQLARPSPTCCKADDRLVVVVEPCSIHDHDLLEYGTSCGRLPTSTG